MKKKLMNFADSLLSREQMKKVKGGYEDGEQPNAGSCTKSMTCGTITTTCTSATGACSSSSQYETQKWIKCDNDKYTC